MCPDEVDLLDPGGIMSFLELNRGDRGEDVLYETGKSPTPAGRAALYLEEMITI